MVNGHQLHLWADIRVGSIITAPLPTLPILRFTQEALTGLARSSISQTIAAQPSFLFGSDGYVTGEGWYIDDVRVESDPLGIDEPGVPTPCFTLQGNYPNPFNPETTIRFSLPGSAAAKLEIFNIKGQKVRTLLDSVMAAGQHSLVWNGLDDALK